MPPSGCEISSLLVIEIIRGAKHVHPQARFVCACGRERIARATSVRRGLITQCAPCAKAAAAKRGGDKRRLPEQERRNRDRWSVYRQNAKAKRLLFDLSLQQFALLLAAPCDYCGAAPSGGVDRLDSTLGYTVANCAPCCSTCNYAKRELSRDVFIDWVQRVHDHQSVLQRDRSVLLCVVEQPDGRGAYQAGDDLQQVDRRSDADGRGGL